MPIYFWRRWVVFPLAGATLFAAGAVSEANGVFTDAKEFVSPYIPSISWAGKLDSPAVYDQPVKPLK